MARIDNYYPPSPENVPEDLVKPTGDYNTRVVLLLLSLILFFSVYLGLFFGAIAMAIITPIYILPCFGIIVSIPCILFALFLVKGFFKSRGPKEKTTQIEITEEDQPLLFEFIARLCEETGAPFPRKIFIVPDVNAAVLTSTSPWGLIFPQGKDLLIGLGLVNILNLSEFKAVMAHEFGHFAQKSSRLSAYSYNADRIIYDLVYGRDGFDRFIEGMCSIGVRGRNTGLIALFGWSIYGVIWMFRKVLEGFHYLITLLRLSLSRQMEFNADLVAVSVAGSDAGIHALYRLTFCDQTWEQAINDLRAASQHEMYSSDIFVHLNHAANYLRKQKKDQKLGEPPPLPEDVRDTPDLFKEDDEHGTPKMWATHPSNFEREQNAKEYYIRSVIDNRSAWVLFKEPQKLREEVTYRLYRVNNWIKKDQELRDAEEVQAFIDDEHAETTYDARYHSLYDERFIEIEELEDLVAEANKAGWNEGRLERVHVKLYDNELKEWMEGYNSRREERRLLSGLVTGDLELKGEDLEFRGRTYDVAEAKRLMKKVDKELEEDRQYLEAFDRRAFLVYYQMATQVSDKLAANHEFRYDFHLTCQKMLRRLVMERSSLQNMLDAIADRGGQLPQHEFRAMLRSCRDARKALDKVLEEADDLPMPDLANMKKGKPLGHFLLKKNLVEKLDRDEYVVTAEWIRKLMSQLLEVENKLRRIHFKSLGGILLMQDRIHQRWKEQLASMPVVQAAAPPAPSQAPVGKAVPIPTNSAPRPVAPGQAVKSATTPPKAGS